MEIIDITNIKILIPALTFIWVIFIGAIILLLRKIKRKSIERRLFTDASMETEQVSAAKKSGFLQFIEKVGNVASHGHASTNLWEQLIRAGYLGKGAPAIYTGIKILLFFGGVVGMALWVAPMDTNILTKTSLISLGGAVPFFLPNLLVLLREKKRRDEIRHHLPYVVDLLEVCVSSGIGLDMAWNMVADEIQTVSPILGSAMDLSNFEIHLGASRAQAMRNMAARTGADQLSSLAAILVQSERFGTSIAAALREFAASMREERRLTAEENAEKMAVKLVIPMVLFIFPAIGIIVVGPAVLNIARVIFS